MPPSKRPGVALSNARLFLSTTALHGLHYLPGGRNRAETLFWLLVVAVSVVWALGNCINAFLVLRAEPIMVNIESLRYDPGAVPYPAITICPVQHLDDLSFLETVLNRVQFTCRADGHSSWDKERLDVGMCEELQDVRARDSPVWLFLQYVDLWLDAATDHIGKYLMIPVQE